jgi:hypothetical protein
MAVCTSDHLAGPGHHDGRVTAQVMPQRNRRLDFAPLRK